MSFNSNIQTNAIGKPPVSFFRFPNLEKVGGFSFEERIQNMKIENRCSNPECPHHKEIESILEINGLDTLLRVKTSGGTVPFGPKFWDKRPVEFMTIREIRNSNWSLQWCDWNPEDAKMVNEIAERKIFAESMTDI